MSDDDFLWRHLKDLPAFRALLRSVEARFYQDLLPLEEPVLDVGGGDGHFSSVARPGSTVFEYRFGEIRSVEAETLGPPNGPERLRLTFRCRRGVTEIRGKGKKKWVADKLDDLTKKLSVGRDEIFKSISVRAA